MYRPKTVSAARGLQSPRPMKRSELSMRSAVRKKLLAPGWLGNGTSAMIDAAYGSIRFAGIMLFANGRPVVGSLIGDVKMQLRWSAVGTLVIRVTPRVMRVPS